MKTATFRLGLVLGLLALASPQLWASVAITSPTGGNNISADKALNSTNGAAFTALGNIVIAEGLASDFAAGTNQTLILAPPTGWQFNPGVGTVTFASKGNITAASMAVTSSSATITLTVNGISAMDTLTIGGLQVQALSGSNLAGDYIRTAYPNPGTEVIAGIDTYATFGLLNLAAGSAKALSMQTQPGATSTAGARFSPQPAVQLVDQFGNMLSLDSSTVVTAALASGTGPLQGNLRCTDVFGVATYTNLSVNVAGTITLQFSATNLTSVTSTPIVVGPAPAQYLVFTTQPGSASAGVPFSIQPVIKTQDRFGSFSTVGLAASQLVTVTLSAGSGILLGTTTLDIGTAAGNGTVTFTNLEIDAAGTNKQLTAASLGLTNGVSASFSVSSALYKQLQVLLPGETAAPGTTTGKTGTPNPQAAGTPFNATVNAVDANWNLVNTIVDNVGITASDSRANLPANAALVSGSKTFSLTLNTVGSATVTATDLTDSSKLPNTGSAITVGGGTPKQLALQSPPSSSVTAGVAFAQQPVIAVEDAGGNLVATDNGRVITVARGLGTGTLQGSLTATTVNGLATFTNLSYNLAQTITLNFTASGLTNVSSGNIVVGTGPFAKLQLLVPGQSAAPGTSNGFTGTPSPGMAGTAFNVTVNAVDAFWNLITNVTDDVAIGSTDASALLPPDAALVNGTGLFSLTFKTAGSQTLTASDVTDGSKSPATSTTLSVNPGAFAKLQLLAPGEAAVPGSIAGKSGTPTAQTAGTAFALTVNAVDANWNLISTNDTVSITSSDANATLPPNTPLSGGTRIFSVTNKTAGGWTYTASDATHTGITAYTSAPISLNAGTFVKLQVLMPGESAAPGTTIGKTSTPTAQTAGTAFNLTVNAVDANWNVVGTVTDMAAITSSDPNANLPVSTALVAGSQTFSVTLRTAGTRTLTASDVTDGTKTASTSPALTVNPGAFVGLQLLMPGQTPAPGTATGSTGTPAAQTAGTAFNVTVNAVDAWWNLVTSVTHTVGITSSDTAAILPANAALVSGTKAFSLTLRTAGPQTVTATDITDSTKTSNASPGISVIPSAPTKLVIQTQPSATAMSGVAFAQQPVIYVTDASGNMVTTNGLAITAARGAGTGTLQGTLTATTVNGIATFGNLSHNVATTITVNFTASGLTNVTSANIQVGPAAFTRLQLLVPGQTSAPGTTNGFSGSPAVQIAGSGFPVTVNAVDAFWNLVNTVTDTVGLSSSDATASLPPNAVLAAGTTNLMLTFNTNGNFTLTATNLSDSTKTASTSPAITVNPAQSTPATGGSAIPADGAVSGTFTSLSGPSYSENATSNASPGTIVLTVPSGFIFDTGGTAPTVLITRLTGSGSSSYNINSVSNGTAVAMSSVTSNQLSFTITRSSTNGVTCKLTWQNVRVRPTAGTPLASGTLKESGTANVMGLSTNSSLGILREIAGSAKNLAIQTQPSATATAGVPFAQQPVLQVRDQFGNLRSSANGVSDSTVVTAARGAGSGTLQGTLNATATNGIATFINLSHNVATNITLAFSASGLIGTNSSIIAVGPAAASQLVFATQPGSSTYGSALSPQPVLQTLDPFGNNSTVGLGTSQLITLSLSAGTGALQGTTSLDIGTAAGNGMAAFSGLSVSLAGTGKQLSAASTGLTSATSSTFAVNTATVSASVTANNKVYDGTTAATLATSTVIGMLPGDSVSLSGGTAVFSSKTVGTNKTVTVSGLSLSGPSAANYQLASTSATTTASITTRPLTVSATATNKVYDGTTTATITLSDNRVAGDSLTDTYTSASFADKNVGTAKTVSVSGIAVSGTDAPNYQLSSTTATASANISARSLTVTATGVNKIYDATATATVTLSDNRVSGDNLTNAYTSASFANKNVGTGKTVSVSGITISGTDAANYSANPTASTTANITARSLTVSATGVNKVYDGSTNATVTLADNRLSGDNLSENYTSASFVNKNVGTAKSISVSGIALSGTDASNYSANTTATASADITARSLSVTTTGVNKVYDATTAATVTLSDNRVSGDSLTDTYTSASFADKNVGTNKPVSVSGISISGTDATNYQLSSTTTNTTANISVATLTAQVSVNNKVYDGTTAATISTNSLNGVLGSDNVSLSTGAASFADKKVGANKTVTVTGLSLAGTDAANYQLGSSSTSTAASITARSLTVSAAGVDKVYDATTNATVTLSDNRVNGDSLTDSYLSASFADKNVGTAKPVSVSGIFISGTDASNYTANATASTTATITARSLTVSATGVNKLYDATTNATVTLADNRLAGDSLTDAYTSANFANKNVGTNKPVTVSGIAISGTDALNYTANSATNTTATITAKGLTVSGITASNKVYDATTTATLNTTGASLSGVLSGDSVTLNSGSGSGAFADKNAGIAKTVTVSALSLSGTDAGNYSLTQPTTIANITQAPLTITANNQTRAAGQSNPTLTASYTGFVGGETLATSGVTGSPALNTTTTNVAGTYPITASQGTLSALNYSFSFVNGILTVTPASASTLVILTQPSSTATAGVVFAQQPAIGIQDAYGNLLNTNGLVVTAARGAGTGTLQGTLTASTLNGVASFASLSHNVANTINLSFSSGGLTNITSANILVSPAAFTRLQLLVPGQTSAPGTTNGFSGSPSAQVAGTSFPVTVNAVDTFYNLVNTGSDTVGLSASDITATLPSATALAGGTTNLTVFFNANGNFTLTATDLSDGSKPPRTSPAISVSGAQFTSATGGSAIAADGAVTSTFTTLSGPTYSENASGNVGTGTIILKTPAGFVFDTGGTAPTVKITSSGSAAKNINAVSSGTSVAMTSVTSTQLTFTVTSTSGVTNTLTWQNIRVRPSAGTPLAAGNLTRAGTANVAGLSTNSSLGILREIAGSAKNLAIQTQPSATATAGVPFAQQPVLQVRDQFGNLRSTANGVTDSTLVAVARGAGSGTLQGTLSTTATNGIATFINLSHNVATNITLAFSASGLIGTNSSIIAVGPAAASQLVFATQPGSSTYGSALSPQPVLQTLDPFGNNSAVGLGTSQLITLSLSAGTGALQGTTSLDIGTAAGNGMAAFSGLSVSLAGTGKQLSAASTGLTSATSSTFAISQATVTGSVTANDKVYDGTAAATIATRTLSGALPGDDVSLSGGTAAFSSKTVGSAKTVTATSLSLSGLSAPNYQLASTSATTTANVTTRSLTVSATATNKVYDGTTTATVTLSDNRVSGDSLTDTYASASFADKNVGTAKTVSVSGISVSGTDAPNYRLSSTTAGTTANITARALSVSATATNKVYDGTTTATVTLSDNRVSGDNLTNSYTSASFTDKNVGTAKPVTVSGITISGTDAPNYTANTSANTTANITVRPLTVSATGVSKVYDGSTNATVTLADNRLSGDNLSENYTSASFANKNVGTAKPVTVSGISLSGTDASNYSANTTASASADITARSLTVTATGLNKVYDATTAATVTLSDNRVSGDSLTDTYTSASFADKNVGTNKPVSVSGISISGTDATNYQLSSTTTNTTANISVATLTARVSVNNKVYDGTTAATISTNSLNGVLGSDNVSLSTGAASFADKKVGANKTVTVTGLSLAGTDAANYQLGSSSTSTAASITARSLTVSAAGVDKVYDATTNATVTLSDNRVNGDSLTDSYLSASFADKNVGTAKPVSVSGIFISGTDASNYTANATASTTATITARSLTVSATGVNKLYDATTNATVTLADNRLAGDSLTDAYTSANFANKNVGTNKPVTVSGIAISGTDALNYTANSATNTTATITAKGLTVSGITASNKVYDATTTATLNTTGASLSGVLSGDSVTLNSGSGSGAFADKNAGIAKTVTVSALSLSGTDAGNYSLTQPTTIANITQAPLTITANNQTRAAGQSNPTLTASYTGFVGGETLATSGVTGSPALNTTTTNVAGTYPITASQGTLSALNYSFSFVNGILTVTPASASTLVIVTQPSSTATAGVVFAQQPAIGIQDAYGNLLNTNGLVVTAARGAGSGTLQGTLTATAVNGVASFASLSHNVANTINLSFSSGGLTNITSANILVSPAAFTRLQLLVPGQTSAPGTTNGFSGSPSAQVAGTSFPVTVNAVDTFYNLVNTVTDLTGITSSDVAATLPANAALVAGTQSFNVTLNTSGSATLTASDLTDSSKSPSTSSAITISPAQFTPAIGGAAISADSAATSTFTALTGPTYTENNAGNVGTGTIILNAPIGFVFDIGGTAPTVKITSGGSSFRNINGVSSGTAVAMTSVTSTQLTFTVTSSSSSGVTNTLTWQNVRVRPTAGTPLALGNLTRSGTASVVGLSTNGNLGTLREVAGAANNLAIQTQPSATATAGVPFAQQPVLQVRDQFGNLRSSANGVSDSTMVTAARGAGSGTLQGTLSTTATNGIATFINLSHNVATNITLAFSASGLTGTNSSTIAVGPAAASQLVFATQPGNGTVGVPLATQPALITRDPFGNNSAVGLGPSKNLTVTLSAGSGPLLGTATLDIGSSAGNGAVTFTNLSVGSAGTNQQLTASAVGLSSAASSLFSVIKNSQSITFGVLANQIYGNAPFTVSAIASSGLPVTFSIVSGPATIVANTVTMTGVGTVTVQAAQAGNTAWAAATPVVQSFTVAKATLTVAADNKNRGYGTANPMLTASYTGFVNGDNASVLSGNPNLSTTATTGSPVPGSPYPITVTQGTLTAANYNFIFVPGALTITKATLTVTAVNQVRTYGAPNPALTLSYSGFVNGDNASVLSGSPTLSTTATAASPVASSPYAITVTPGSLTAANYYFTFVNGNLSVLPAALAVSAADASRAYGQTNPVFSGTLTGVQNGDNITASYNTTATNASPVGTYPIIPTLADPDGMLANYTVAFTNGTLTVSAAELVGTVADQSRPYRQANPLFTVQYSGFVNGDDQSVLSGQFVATTAATPSSPVGTYPINGAGQSASNYLVTYVSGTLTITSAALTVQANDASRLYGDPNPGFNGAITGVQSGDNITASYTSAATVQSPVGTYAIVPTLSAPQGILSNYTVAVIDGTLTVTPAALALVANNATRPYGQTNPVFTGSVSGVRNGDNITATYTTSATVGSPVGTYDIVPSLSDPDGKLTNYTLSTTNGKLTISPATLTVTAKNQSRAYGAPNPTLTASYSGFVAGDDASVLSGSPALSTTATASSSVAGGPYPITAALGTLSAVNYTFVFSAGQLTITPASSLIAVISSANPSPTGSNVMFTAALAGVAPSFGVPTGTVQFMVDGAPLSAPVNVAGGSASLTIATLSHGIHTIAAGYEGDGNFFGTTNSLWSNQVVNIPPVATLATYTRGSNDWLQISIPDLLTNHTSDADGDPLTLVSVTSGTNGASVLLYQGSIYYLPSTTNPNADTTDYLDYAVTDGFPGGTVTNEIRIQLDPPLPTLPTPSTLTQISCGAGTFTLTFNGSASTTYRVQRAAALQSSGTVWTNIGSATTDSAGHGQFTDTNPPPCQGYYRTVSP